MNTLFCISPYWHNGMWVFDDLARGLSHEPFVAGVPDMIDDLVRDIPNARRGFTLIFSAQKFPRYQRCLEYLYEEENGHWYLDTYSRMEGWLCPALLKYFPTAPNCIYVQAIPFAKED